MSQSCRPLPVLLAVLLAACGGKKRHDLLVRSGPELELPESLAVAPTVLLHAEQLVVAPQGGRVVSRPFTPEQHDAAESEDDGSEGPDAASAALLDVFYANYYIGKVWTSGGYDMLPEVGNQVRSLGLEFSLGPEYATQVQEWTDRTLGEVLSESGVAWTSLGESVEAALVPPTRRTVRGSGPLDGEDNQNLPRFESLQPSDLAVEQLPGISADAVLVPIVVHYFAHNGGWFVGQGHGTPAGARFRLLWALHDPSTGAVLTWGDVSARYVEPYFYSPNDVQLQDYLLAVEARVRTTLEAQLEH